LGCGAEPGEFGKPNHIVREVNGEGKSKRKSKNRGRDRERLIILLDYG